MFHALSINKFYIILTALLILSTAAHGDEQVRLQAIADAQTDAQLAVNRITWQLTGCVGNIFGLGVAFIHEPRLPAGRLIGKSPVYVEYYTNEFRRETQGLQIYHAATGCATFSISWFIVWYIF